MLHLAVEELPVFQLPRQVGIARGFQVGDGKADEAVGGDLNAFTTKEYTCYYARVLDVDVKTLTKKIRDFRLERPA